MKTPKERFIAGPQAAGFKTMASTIAFETACDYALLHLQYEMPVNCQPNRSIDPLLGFDANAQMDGARKVIEILKHLAEKSNEPTPISTPTLHY